MAEPWKHLERPERPSIIREFLETCDTVADQETELYRCFLLAVEKVQRDMFAIQSKCTIKMFHKIQADDSDFRKEEGNSSLRSIFFFYSRIQMSGNITFDDTDVSNITISLYELVSILRDFDVIPTLISREDVNFLWKVMSMQTVKSGEGQMTSLDLNQFKEFIARCAIIAYNRPAMRRLLLNIKGKMPTQPELVEMFAQNMGLENYPHIRELINTKGKTRKFNQNRKGQVNEEVRQELRDDLKAKRMAKVMKKADVLKFSESTKKEDNMAKTMALAIAKKKTGLDIEDSRTGNQEEESTRFLTGCVVGTISAAQEVELLNYDSLTTKVLDKYCLNPLEITSKVSNDGFQTCDGAFIDLGELAPGHRCVINMDVRNNTREDVQLDVTARGFPSKDIQITTTPNSFAPGMKRHVTITFTVHRAMFDVVGYIDLVLVPVRNGPAINISCPVYYRISVSESIRRLVSLPVCSVRTLPELLRKYCSRSLEPVVTFEKTRLWYKGRNFEEGPYFSSELLRETDKEIPLPGCYRGLRTTRSPLKFPASMEAEDLDNSQPLLL